MRARQGERGVAARQFVDGRQVGLELGGEPVELIAEHVALLVGCGGNFATTAGSGQPRPDRSRCAAET